MLMYSLSLTYIMLMFSMYIASLNSFHRTSHMSDQDRETLQLLMSAYYVNVW